MTSVVYAKLDGYPDVEIGRIVFDIRFDDVHNPYAAGPADRNCANSGTKTDT